MNNEEFNNIKEALIDSIKDMDKLKLLPVFLQKYYFGHNMLENKYFQALIDHFAYHIVMYLKERDLKNE